LRLTVQSPCIQRTHSHSWTIHPVLVESPDTRQVTVDLRLHKYISSISSHSLDASAISSKMSLLRSEFPSDFRPLPFPPCTWSLVLAHDCSMLELFLSQTVHRPLSAPIRT